MTACVAFDGNIRSAWLCLLAFLMELHLVVHVRAAFPCEMQRLS